jgi:pyruvate/2-oxoglutarate dehydrogenase complex dihydrolipoamide dehydrogenase (E3) component
MKEMLPSDDEYNRTLVHNVHPPDWTTPEPTGRYNLVVIGAGTAGLVTAVVAAGLGAKVALIEKDLMGGDCLNVGCVPSKALLRASRMWAQFRQAEDFSVRIPQEVRYDFAAAMARMRKLRARINPIDSAHRYQKLGVDVYLGTGRFTGMDTVEVEGKTLTFKRAAICTGTRAAVPPVPGLQEAGYLTNETVFSLTALPRRLGIIGGDRSAANWHRPLRALGAKPVCSSRWSASCRTRMPMRRRSCKSRWRKMGSSSSSIQKWLGSSDAVMRSSCTMR